MQSGGGCQRYWSDRSRTVHAAFQAVEARFRTSSAGFGSPGLCFRTSLARLSAVERRFRDCEARGERSGTRSTASSGEVRRAEVSAATSGWGVLPTATFIASTSNNGCISWFMAFTFLR